MEGFGVAVAAALSDRGSIDPAPLDPAAATSGSFYDAVPYDGGAQAALLPGRVRGAAAALGFAPGEVRREAGAAAPDVLDVGCGAGAQLLAAAHTSAGRMVGIDASAQACDVARGRGAGFGARWEIHHGGDGLLDPAVLGQFDVIYVIGTLYVMPAEVRARVLAGIAACLRPGGVVAVSYYAGVSALVRTRLARLLRDQNDPAWPVSQQVATARANIRQIAAAVPPEGSPQQGASRAIVQETLSSMAGYGDTVLFHEALGPVFDTLLTADVAAALAERGVGFVNCLPAVPVQAGATSRAAALAADAWDFATGGGYRLALFGRDGGGAAVPGLSGRGWSGGPAWQRCGRRWAGRCSAIRRAGWRCGPRGWRCRRRAPA